MKLLGVDFGTRRTGLAIGETDPFFVGPLRTVEGDDAEAVAKEVAGVADAEGAKEIVVGMPVSLGGGERGVTAERVRQFIAHLELYADMPIRTEDERFSTTLAARYGREYGTNKKKFDRDAVAAAVLLESYIEGNFKLGA